MWHKTKDLCHRRPSTLLGELLPKELAMRSSVVEKKDYLEEAGETIGMAVTQLILT